MKDSIDGSLGSFGSTFDYSMMNTRTNAELTIELKIYLQKRAGGTASDSDSNTFDTIDWTTAAWDSWKKKFKATAQKYWHGKFWLRTPDSYRKLVYPVTGAMPTHLCNIWCKFNLVLTESPASAHKTIDVVRLKPLKNMSSGTFRSNDSLYDNYDLGYGAYKRGKRLYYQRTFVHEVGHALGLPHIGVLSKSAECSAESDKNSDVCYGVVHSDRRDIMGFGEALTIRDARPWIDRLAQHLEIVDADAAKFTPKMMRTYPRPIPKF